MCDSDTSTTLPTRAHTPRAAGARRCRHLHTLALDLQDNVLGDPGVAALAALSRCPALASLSLDVMNNELGDGQPGAREWRGLSRY